MDPRERQELKDLVNKAIDEGKSPDEVITNLKEAGYSKSEIKDIIYSLDEEAGPAIENPEPTSPFPRDQQPPSTGEGVGATKVNPDEIINSNYDKPPLYAAKAKATPGKKPKSRKGLAKVLAVAGVIIVLIALYYGGFLPIDDIIGDISGTISGVTGSGATGLAAYVPADSVVYAKADVPKLIDVLDSAIAEMSQAMPMPATSMGSLSAEIEQQTGINPDDVSELVFFSKDSSTGAVSSSALILKGGVDEEQIKGLMTGDPSEDEYGGVKILRASDSIVPQSLGAVPQTTYFAFLEESTLMVSADLGIIKESIDLKNGDGKNIGENERLMSVVSRLGTSPIVAATEIDSETKNYWRQQSQSFSSMGSLDFSFIANLNAVGFAETSSKGKSVLLFSDRDSASEGKENLEEIRDMMIQTFDTSGQAGYSSGSTYLEEAMDFFDNIEISQDGD
jgi:hypothetical protein